MYILSFLFSGCDPGGLLSFCYSDPFMPKSVSELCFSYCKTESYLFIPLSPQMFEKELCNLWKGEKLKAFSLSILGAVAF